MGTNRNYLFCDGNLGHVLSLHLAKVQERVDQIPEARFSNQSDEEIAGEIQGQMTVVPLSLGAPTMTKEETKVDVSNDPMRSIFHDELGERGPVLVPGIRVRVSLPFKGEADLWKLTPSSSRFSYPAGRIRQAGDSGGVLDLTIEQPADQPQEEIKRRFDSQMEDIRFFVQNQRVQVDAENARLPALIQAAITNRRERLRKHDDLADLLGIPETPKLYGAPSSVDVSSAPTPVRRQTKVNAQWDVFISHASEDKDVFVRPLAEALLAKGLRVWFDEFALRVGDSLRRSIDKGLAESRHGIVVISPAFLSKEWPQKELDGLVAKEVDGRKVILPVWHDIDADGVRQYSLILADRVATSSARGLTSVVNDLLAAIGVR